MTKGFFVSGIGTEVGKTVTSAVLVHALKANYWKPVQAGDLEDTDTDKVKRWTQTEDRVYYPETYRLNTPASPHLAAKLDGVSIDLTDFKVPASEAPLVIEGAGGLHVPLNDTALIIDLIQQLGFPVVLVSRHYLGSINHSLLSFEALKARNIPIAGWIFNGKANEESERIIAVHSKAPVLGRIPHLESLSYSSIQAAASPFSFLKG